MNSIWKNVLSRKAIFHKLRFGNLKPRSCFVTIKWSEWRFILFLKPNLITHKGTEGGRGVKKSKEYFRNIGSTNYQWNDFRNLCTLPLLQSESISPQNDPSLCNFYEKKREMCWKYALCLRIEVKFNEVKKSAPFLNKIKRSQSECLVDGGFRAQIGCQSWTSNK